MSAVVAPPRVALAILDAGDTQLRTHDESWRTLDPSRSRARSLATIGGEVLGEQPDGAAALAFAEGLVTAATAMREAFPDNLFWDLDAVAGAMWRHGAGDPAGIERYAASIAAVHRVFGRNTAIGFAYVHDFVYGYDWAKWVAKDRRARSGVEPLSPAFIAVMQARGHELLEVIAARSDDKYPPLSGERPRNPFGFSREPADELRLHRALAARGQIPVRAWEVRPPLDTEPDYAGLRLAAAATLGLTVPAA